MSEKTKYKIKVRLPRIITGENGAVEKKYEFYFGEMTLHKDLNTGTGSNRSGYKNEWSGTLEIIDFEEIYEDV